MKKVCILFVVLLLALGLTACEEVIYFPESGIWYCEELGAQIYAYSPTYVPVDYDFLAAKEGKEFVTIDGERITCSWSGGGGQQEVNLTCAEEDNPRYNAWERIYTYKFVSLTDTEYVISDPATGKQYTFIRIGDTPPRSTVDKKKIFFWQ